MKFIGIAFMALGLVYSIQPAGAQALPGWRISEICARDSAEGQCRLYEAVAHQRVAASWDLLPREWRQSCLNSIRAPLEPSWRILSDCMDSKIRLSIMQRKTKEEAVELQKLEALEARRKAEAEVAARKAAAEAEAERKAEEEARRKAEAEVAASKAAVPVMVIVNPGLDTCAWGEITKAAAVRSGPGIGYPKIDALKTGTGAWLYENKGDWHGIAYGPEADEVGCLPSEKDKAYDGPGKSGWIHKKHLGEIAG